MNKKRSLIISITLVLCTFLALPAWCANMFEKEVEKEAGAVKLARETSQGGYGLVTTAELKQWVEAKKDMTIVDTMPYEASFKKQHIPGAKQFLFPIPEMKTWDTAETAGKSQADYVKLLGPDKGKTLVIYCGFVKCTRSHNGAVWAKKLGYTRVYRYPGGIYAWRGAKHRWLKENNSCNLCLPAQFCIHAKVGRCFLYLNRSLSMSPQANEMIERVSQKAGNLFSTKQLMCAESLLVSFNEVFEGGLTRQQAVGLSAGLATGMGGSGCLCGALGGGSLSLGLILPGCNTGPKRRKLRKATSQLHQRFKQEFGSTCCKVLSRRFKNDSRAHFSHCKGLTQATARMTAEVLLELRPELAQQPVAAKRPCLDNLPCGRLRGLISWLCG